MIKRTTSRFLSKSSLESLNMKSVVIKEVAKAAVCMCKVDDVR